MASKERHRGPDNPVRGGPRTRCGRAGTKSLARPKPEGCPAHLERGTDEYRRWEAGEIVLLAGRGLTASQICQRLNCTEDEYTERRRWIRTHAEPGDSALAFLDFCARTARVVQEAEEVIATATKKQKQTSAYTGTLRLLHDLHLDVVKTALSLGWIRPMLPAPEDPKPGETPQQPATAVRGAFLVEILERAGGGVDPNAMTQDQILAALRRFAAERGALLGLPNVPTLQPGKS